MFFNNRKGVSEVVANVLIVLLVIVGIAVVWSVVKPTIDKSAKQISGSNECFSANVQVVSCAKFVCTDGVTFDSDPTPAVVLACPPGCTAGASVGAACTGGTPTNVDWNVVLKRNPGVATLNGMKLIFSDASGSTSVNSLADALNELGTVKIVNASDGNTLTATQVNVAAVVGADQKTCDIISGPVTCQ